MNIDVLKSIVKIAKDEGVAELEVEAKDFKVSVSFVSSHTPVVHHSAPVAIQAAPSPVIASATAIAASNAKAAAASDAGLHIIKSPFVGTFYGSPSPGKPTYVKVGDKVKVGQTLCILEAMKIMNEIDADISGEIVEACVDTESLVEFGQPLFKIRPS
ncbi:MAG: acetyl-CoA carboxylase biotin carboxyl carrier protein [Bacteriovoracaceae bacterium]|jgi:acetyl-CoA carboxylase biotin carboxyl carrier protein